MHQKIKVLNLLHHYFFLIQFIESFYTNFNAFKEALQYYKDLKIDNLQEFFFLRLIMKKKLHELMCLFWFLFL